jgi:hypothetical protein
MNKSRRGFIKGLAVFGVTTATAAKAGLTDDPSPITEDARWLSDKLRGHTPKGYYKWTPTNESHTLWFREPKSEEELPDETWLSDEPNELIHLCDASAFRRAVDSSSREGAADACGYVREARCHKCGYVLGS